MNWVFAVLILLLASAGTFIFGILAYALRDYSRARLAEFLEKRNRAKELDRVVEHEDELIFTANAVRLAFNIAILLSTLHLVSYAAWPGWAEYAVTFAITFLWIAMGGVLLPHVVAEHGGEAFIGTFYKLLHVKRLLLAPLAKLIHPTDRVVRRAAGYGPVDDPDEIEEEYEQEILSVVEEGEEEGVIDEQEREMIGKVIAFSDTTAGEVMTSRPEIVALPLDAPLPEIVKQIVESGHSRIPVYGENIEQVKGVLYARDLIPFVGTKAEHFDVHQVMRPPLFVPESKTLRDLLTEFQLQKIHMAIVLDEYGGVAGLVTIEDVLEELVGEISDEHEPVEEAMFKRLDDDTAEADARMHVEEFNRMMGLKLPEEEGYDTLGGFVSTMLGRIPQTGESFEHRHNGTRATFTVLDAEPHRVNRIRVDLAPAEEPVAEPVGSSGK